MPTAEQLFDFLRSNPHVVVPVGAVVGEFLVILATRRNFPALDRVLVVAEVTAFTAASTVLAAGALQGTFLTTRLPNVTGVAALFGYVLVLPFLWFSTLIAPPQPLGEGTLEQVARTGAGLLLLVFAGIYFWASLFLAAVLP